VCSLLVLERGEQNTIDFAGYFFTLHTLFFLELEPEGPGKKITAYNTGSQLNMIWRIAQV
jgi:hypothetical protein